LADIVKLILKKAEVIRKYYDADALLRQDYILDKSVIKFMSLMAKLPFEVQLQAFCEHRLRVWNKPDEELLPKSIQQQADKDAAALYPTGSSPPKTASLLENGDELVTGKVEKQQ